MHHQFVLVSISIILFHKKGRLPVKWTAYEALLFGTYTTQSDVWSYGVLLYEILTVGGSPYPGIHARQIARKLQEGFRMPKPKHVDNKLYQIMLKCWEENPSDRPTFAKLKDTMKEMEGNHRTYVNLKQYDSVYYVPVKSKLHHLKMIRQQLIIVIA
ncbi:tyrosine-protein kinase receptor Tie-1-like [Orbicella faveolata]|uniref:tyrosine-protein kinase receptor Tie-1-like n=1 Tax=Orbicella faveolata TaxID=48498 RepID=UPI0009E2CEB7|nr:tyrosine-protein kinase receptor Tie-1-like [Orbicella faveolata]